MTYLRILTIRDIGQAKRLSDAEKWNQTEKDWEFLIRNPGNVCLAFETGGQIIGTATAMNYQNRVAWIGMVLVDSNFRGQGISKLLLAELLDRLKGYPSVKLDATPAGQNIYSKFGFRDEYMIHRMTVMAVPAKAREFERDASVLQSQPCDFQELVEYDRSMFGVERKFLLEFFLKNYPERAWVLKKEKKIEGFALGRKGNHYDQVGLVAASTEDEAKRLISKSLSNLERTPVVIDILEDKEDLAEWLKAFGFTKQRHFIRMCRNKHTLSGITENQFLICGPEFG